MTQEDRRKLRAIGRWLAERAISGAALIVAAKAVVWLGSVALREAAPIFARVL